MYFICLLYTSICAAIGGKTILKEIYVPGKLVNLVVK